MYKAAAVKETLFFNEFAYFKCEMKTFENAVGDTEITRYQFQINNKIADNLMSTTNTYKYKIGDLENKLEIKCRAKNSLGFGFWSDAFVFNLQRRSRD